VQSIKGTDKVEGIVTDKGEYPLDYVLVAVGFRPNNLLGQEQLELLYPNGPYKVFFFFFFVVLCNLFLG
jgi:NADPH-dependent 2,4-dienoyl-CoA reductase/sulfur reductase-like enzyme